MPLLCSGITGHGSLLFFDPLPDGRYRMALDEWGFGLLVGPEFDAGDKTSAIVDVMVGPALETDPETHQLLGDREVNALRRRLLVWYDGKLVGNFVLEHHLDSYGALLVGKNEAGFSSASADFIGDIQSMPLGVPLRKLLLKQAIAACNP